MQKPQPTQTPNPNSHPDLSKTLKLLYIHSHIQQQHQANLTHAFAICNHYGWRYKKQNFKRFVRSLKNKHLHLKEIKLGLFAKSIEDMYCRSAFDKIKRKASRVELFAKHIGKRLVSSYKLKIQGSICQLRSFVYFLSTNEKVIQNFVR